MKILYVGNFEPYYRTENYVTHGFESLGIQVEKFPYQILNNFRYSIRRVQEEKPDFVLFSKACSQGTTKFLGWLKSKKIKTVCWAWDLFFVPKRMFSPITFNSDFLFTTDGGTQNKWSSKGFNHKVLRQGVHEPECRILNETMEPERDIVFIGTGTSDFQPGRGELVDFLRSTYGLRFTLLNSHRGWTLNGALRTCKLVVGDSYPSPYYWSNRLYEVTGRGGVLLHPRTVGLEAEFTPGKEFIEYERGNFPSLKRLIDQTLEDEELIQSVRTQGFQKTKENYTYTKRCSSLLSMI